MKNLHKNVILLEFDMKKDLFTLEDIVKSVNYLKN